MKTVDVSPELIAYLIKVYRHRNPTHVEGDIGLEVTWDTWAEFTESN